MDPLWSVIILLLFMFMLTFISGYCPGLIKSPKAENLMGILGGGFLMGVALIVVLPEAVKALVDANRLEDNGEVFTEAMILQVGFSVLTGFYVMLLINEVFHASSSHDHTDNLQQLSSRDNQEETEPLLQTEPDINLELR